MSLKKLPLTLSLASTLLLSGCATPINPNNLTPPKQPRCIKITAPIESHESKGLLDIKWTTRIASGLYISEWENADGTYFRAPPGGIYIVRDEVANDPPAPLTPRYFNGGIWIPKQEAKPALLYTYSSTEDAIVKPVPSDASCDNAVLISGSQAQGVSTIAFAVGGTIGGASGGIVGRSMANDSAISYGQAAGVGAAGGAISGVIIASLINLDAGKIYTQPQSKDLNFRAKLEREIRTITKIKTENR